MKKGLSGIRIFPTIGNHDTYPANIISRTSPHNNKIINEWIPSWDVFIDNEEQQKNFYDWGFYSIPLTDSLGKKLGANGNTKLISIDTNACYTHNWQSMLNFQDPGK